MDAKMRSIIAYLSWIGWLIAYLTKPEDREEMEIFHLRQGLGVSILLFIPIVGLIYMIIGIINAMNMEKKPVPFLGQYFDEWFSFVK